jgi:hypothetical protein
VEKNTDGAFEEWTKPGPSLGFCHDGTQFCSIDSSGKITKYTNWTWPQVNATAWVGASAIATRPTPDYETPVGAGMASFTSPRRAKLTITMPKTGDTGATGSVNAWGLYYQRSATRPTAKTNFKKIGQIGAAGVTSSTTITADPTGVAPPFGVEGGTDADFSSFPGANPAQFSSYAFDGIGPKIKLSGDGSGRIGQASWDAAGNWSGLGSVAGGAALDTYVGTATSAMTVTTSTQTIPGCSVNVTVSDPSDRFLVLASVDFQQTTSDNFIAICDLSVSTGSVSGEAIYRVPSTSNARATVAQHWIVTGLTAGTRAFSYRYSVLDGQQPAHPDRGHQAGRSARSEGRQGRHW